MTINTVRKTYKEDGRIVYLTWIEFIHEIWVYIPQDQAYKTIDNGGTVESQFAVYEKQD